MFDFLFKFSPTAFFKGEFVLLSAWPRWALGVSIVLAAAAMALVLRKRLTTRGPGVTGYRAGAVWLLESLLAALLLLLLWQPALSVATLKPQQNVVAVLVDGSGSMGIDEGGGARLQQAVATLKEGLVESLGSRFQVRLYRAGAGLERIQRADDLKAASGPTQLEKGLRQVTQEAATLPVGAVVLLSDGGENAGGIDPQTLAEIQSRRIPVHAIGYGREAFDKDVEVLEVETPPRALADSRIAARVTFRHSGFRNSKARLTARENGKVLASREIVLSGEGPAQTESLMMNAGHAGSRTLEVAVEPLAGERNARNNALARLIQVESRRPRILYIEGEPRWEYKFIRRAAEEDKSVQLVSLLRTTQNKIYRQGIDNPKELEEGFPARVEDLFGYQALVIGSVEANYFTSSQQNLIAEFVNRRGGGLLFLGGRYSLDEGGWAASPLADLLPVTLSGKRRGTFLRDPATVELTAAGRDSLICRLEEDAAANAERWKKLPYLANYQQSGEPKPGAAVLADLLPTSKGRFPLLVTQNYGRGRTALLATAGTWRWQMAQELSDRTHEMFWQQMLRWLVADTPGPVVSSVDRVVLSDEGRVELRAEVRDKAWLPAGDAKVTARVMGPGGLAGQVVLTADARHPGVFTGEWQAEKAGSYLAEVTASRGGGEAGRDVVLFAREDGRAENFRVEQNRELLEKLASQTGGRYWRPREAPELAENIAYSEAGISVRETRDLWDAPIVLLLALGLRTADWLLRRKWGAV